MKTSFYLPTFLLHGHWACTVAHLIQSEDGLEPSVHLSASGTWIHCIWFQLVWSSQCAFLHFGGLVHDMFWLFSMAWHDSLVRFWTFHVRSFCNHYSDRSSVFLALHERQWDTLWHAWVFATDLCEWPPNWHKPCKCWSFQFKFANPSAQIIRWRRTSVCGFLPLHFEHYEYIVLYILYSVQYTCRVLPVYNTV
jgi:hypothetical protein